MGSLKKKKKKTFLLFETGKIVIEQCFFVYAHFFLSCFLI